MQRSLIFFIGFMLIDFLTCVVAFALERHEDWSLLWPLLLQRFYYRQMMYVVLFRAVMGAVQGKSVGWRGVEPEVPAPVASSLAPSDLMTCTPGRHSRTPALVATPLAV